MKAPVWPSFVLVHGNFLGPWSWERVAETLRARGAHVVAPDLPSAAGDSAPGDLYADARTVRDALDATHAPVILCGHSYGGAVITEAGAEHPAATRLVYLAGAVPDIGQHLASLAPAVPDNTPEDKGEQVRALPDGRIELTPESAAHALFHDCSPAERDRALRNLRPSNPATGAQPLTRAAWHATPATYVRCRHDRMPELVSSGFTATNPLTVELPTGHCPNWSAPDDVAELLLAEAGRI
ncbi:pimeloyl-ACP methyl ester carboxylesterase [Lipingzhangella halophila]|uniref:Pimeloyl-ACP methyl ester carboxylesterase n=1 Tax=Lipingzhangella halophila TaxID=1783352 RepID=A0A7W7RPG1_9ACTN|nr:alpha/beta hydrolase [Lipingzhangella halophila]MBB4935228.1 pimeloyl-ACP methyl ester carboxylesterase [Lipingzhangella halophila]